MSETCLSLQTGFSPYQRVLVHPVVVFNILDHFVRRNDTKRVIGALLGHANEDAGIVEIRNCYPIPHSEPDDTTAAANLDVHKTMLELHRKIQPADLLVGWYSTGENPIPSSVIFQAYFRREMSMEPIHLMVNTDLNKGSLNVNAFYSFSVNDSSSTLETFFMPAPLDYVTSEQEISAFEVLSKSKTGSSVQLSELGSLESALTRLHSTLELLSKYIQSILDKKTVPNTELGRFLQHTMSMLPINEVSFDNLVTNGTLDTLMVIYLANLARAHLLVAEKQREQPNIASGN